MSSAKSKSKSKSKSRNFLAAILISLIFSAFLLPSWANAEVLAQELSEAKAAAEAKQDRSAIESAVAAQSAAQSNAGAEAIEKEKETARHLRQIEEISAAWLKRPELSHSLVGLEIMHIPSGQVIFSHNGRKRFVPASTTKVFSTACAMDMLGPDYKFKTKLLAYGKLAGSHLNGSIYIEASQDPTLKTADLKVLLSALQAKGIKSIEGKLDIVSVAGGGDYFSPQWLLEDWGQDWMPVSSDLVLDDNIARRDPARGYPLISYSLSPDQNAAISSLLRSPQGPAWVCFHPGSKTMQFWHPAGPLVGGQIVGNPNEYNSAAASSIVKSMGIKIKEKPIPNQLMEEPPITLAEHSSKPLSELVKHCLKESDNLYAQQMLRVLGTLPPVMKTVEKASLEERGLARINQWLMALGASPGEALLFDGCGLSRKNCFSPHCLNLIHRHMASSNKAYLDVMPLHGGGGGANSSFRYKTGTMDSVRSISGILITGAGEPLAVTVMVNDHTSSVRDVRASMNAMIDHLQSLGALSLPKLAPQAVKRRQPAAVSGKTSPAKVRSSMKPSSARKLRPRGRHKTR